MSSKFAPPDNPSTRDRLTRAAREVVAREGLEGASVKAIASEAEVTPGLLHYHFPSKDALLEAALRDALDKYLADTRRRRAEVPAARLLDAVFTDARAAAEDDADLFRLRLAFSAAALARPDLAAVVRELNRAASSEMAETLAAAQGRQVPTAQDLAVASVLKAAFDGVMLARLIDPDFPMDTAAEVLRRLAP